MYASLFSFFRRHTPFAFPRAPATPSRDALTPISGPRARRPWPCRRRPTRPSATLRALPSFDCKTVAFGRLIDGSRVLEFIGALDTKMDRPLGKVTVCSCGKLAAVELGDYDQQAAVVRLVRVRLTLTLT